MPVLMIAPAATVLGTLESRSTGGSRATSRAVGGMTAHYNPR